MTIRCTVLLLLLVAVPATAAPAPSDQAWLVSAVAAHSKISFTGTKEVILWSDRGAEASTVEVARLAPTRLRLEYLPTTGRHRRIVIDDGHRRWQYEPASRLALLSASSADEDDGVSGNRLRLLQTNYGTTLVGRGLVAGRPTVILAIRPRVGARPSLRLWVDEATAVILRSERYHVDDRLAEVATFSRIEFREPPEGLFQFAPPAGVTVRQIPFSTPLTLRELAGRVGFVPVAPERLPDGFLLDRVRLDGAATLPVAALQYTDGLATLTLFQRRAVPGARHTLESGRAVPLADGEASVGQIGDVNILHWQTRGLNLTLMGEVTAGELAKIATSLGVDGPPGRVVRVKVWVALLWKRLATLISRP